MKLDSLLITLATSGTALALALPLEAANDTPSRQDTAASGADQAEYGITDLLDQSAQISESHSPASDPLPLFARSPSNSLTSASTSSSADQSSSASSASQNSSSASSQGIRYLRKLMGTISQKLGMSGQEAHDAQSQMEQMLKADAARGQQKTNQLNGRALEHEQEEGEMIVRRVELQARREQEEGEMGKEDVEDENRLLKKREGEVMESQDREGRQGQMDEEMQDGEEEDLMRLANEVRAWKRSAEGQEAYEDFERENEEHEDVIEKRAWLCAA